MELTHGRGWLADDAAASLHRVDSRLGRPTDINEAGRTRATQQRYWDLYYYPDGRVRPASQRPAWLGRPARPGTSLHETGRAIDTDDRIPWIGEHGWIGGRVKGEPWHYEYDPARDQRRPGAPLVGGTLHGLPWTGIQRMLKSDFGYTGAIDNNPGHGTISAFQRFMNAKGYAHRAPGVGGALNVDGDDGGKTLRAAQQWLKETGRYAGQVDAIRGTGTNAGWARADAENGRAYAHIR